MSIAPQTTNETHVSSAPCVSKNQGASRKVLSRVSLVSVMTGISRVFGLVRELIMAYFFGTSAVQSAFVIAFRIPNLFRRLFGEGALGSAFMPVFVELCEKDGLNRASLFAGRIMGILLATLSCIVALIILGTYALEGWLDPNSRWLTVLPLMRIMLPYSILICLAAIISSMLHSRDRFAIASLTPVVLNLVWIAVLLGICPFLPEDGLMRISVVGWGIFCAGFIQVIFQLPELRRAGMQFKISFRGWRSSEPIRRVMTLMIPAALGIGLIQINVCLDGWLAYYAAEWAPAALEYADRIIYLPLGIFASAFMTVLLPTYAKLHIAQAFDELKHTLARALRNLMFVMIPTALGLICFSLEIVKLIYEYGEFNHESAVYTSRAIMAYAPGLIVFSIYKCIVPIFYAMQDVKTPVKVSVWAVGLNASMNVLSIFYLPDGWQHAGMALSTVLSSLFTVTILMILLRRKIGSLTLGAIRKSTVKAFAAGCIMISICSFVYVIVSNWMPLGKLFNAISLIGVIGLGVVLYSGLLYLLDKQAVCELTEDFPLKKIARRLHLC